MRHCSPNAASCAILNSALGHRDGIDCDEYGYMYGGGGYEEVLGINASVGGKGRLLPSMPGIGKFMNGG